MKTYGAEDVWCWRRMLSTCGPMHVQMQLVMNTYGAGDVLRVSVPMDHQYAACGGRHRPSVRSVWWAAQAIITGLRDSVNAFKSEVAGVDAKNVLDLMIVTQYFDMMKEIGAQSKTNAVFMNHSPGALEDLAAAVQKGFMAGAFDAQLASAP
mmetsp:Transcript_27789/g.64852  ORF Transcript_27789/g.64852 Transcript_27789/m.64852 type:complete len:152 (+) Transcript_27789:1140-1595(+)